MVDPFLEASPRLAALPDLRHASVDEQLDASDEARGVAREEDDYFADLARIAQAAERVSLTHPLYLTFDVLLSRRAGQRSSQRRCVDSAGAQDVDANAALLHL